jgi:2-polyprenyl-3-methyl-5-hydroxy-6-metoxy-1,4-benzoquinol methylase
VTTVQPSRAREPFEKAPGSVHDAAFRALRAVCLPGAKVADLGAGTGLWARRLSAEGYRVTPVDNNLADWSLDSIPLVNGDLNHEFAASLDDDFDAVTSLEVLEHLENPTLFMRESAKLLRPGGVAVFTTPNIENVAGRVRFFLSGQLRSFDRDPAWNEPTHITPIQSYLFEKMYRAAGLTLVTHGFNEPTESTRGGMKRLLLGGLRPLLGGVRGGDHHVFVLRKDT